MREEAGGTSGCMGSPVWRSWRSIRETRTRYTRRPSIELGAFPSCACSRRLRWLRLAIQDHEWGNKLEPDERRAAELCNRFGDRHAKSQHDLRRERLRGIQKYGWWGQLESGELRADNYLY